MLESFCESKWIGNGNYAVHTLYSFSSCFKYFPVDFIFVCFYNFGLYDRGTTIGCFQAFPIYDFIILMCCIEM